LAADQIPQAAQQPNFLERLSELGLTDLSRKPTLLEIIAAFTRAVDGYIHERGKRTDLGEMAQHSASETLTSLAGRELPTLFGPTATDVQQALAKLGRSDQFSIVARDFFSRLTSRSLGYFLSRELSKHVGPDKRFAMSHWTCIAGKLRGSSKSSQADGTARLFNKKSKSAKTTRASLRMSRSRRFAPNCASGETPMPERLVLCGEAKRVGAESILRLALDGRSQNVMLKLEDISKRLVQNIPDLLIELIEIASYIYCADQATSRGGDAQVGMGSGWRRAFRFVIPVRDPDHWSNPNVLEPSVRR
jgi:hypothetical protein